MSMPGLPAGKRVEWLTALSDDVTTGLPLLCGFPWLPKGGGSLTAHYLKQHDHLNAAEVSAFVHAQGQSRQVVVQLVTCSHHDTLGVLVASSVTDASPSIHLFAMATRRTGATL